MNFKTLFMPLALSGAIGLSNSESGQKQIREWLIYMHAEQVKLLKINWGNPGLCTEWDRGYNTLTRSCGRRGKLVERSYLK
jgi:hypothetical protein